MNNAIRRAIQVLENIQVIPGYTGDRGRIEIAIDQFMGGARTVIVSFITSEKEVVDGCTIERVKKKDVVIANNAILPCNNCNNVVR